jgi:GDP-6-deoxy-D-talose 4-dehydrogenase
LRILLTGAGGFTGRHYAAAAEGAGHEVIKLAANLTEASKVNEEVANRSFDAVVHLAAISFVGHADDSAFYAVNVVGTTNLLNALARLPVMPRKVVLASSANIYGNCEESPIDEDVLPAPVNHYAMSKLAMEHMARTYSKKLSIIISRPFNYTGPGQAGNFVIPKLVSHFAMRATSISLGNLNVEREFNDVQMVCNAYLQLLQHGEQDQIYNVCSGQPYTLQYVINTLQRITGHHMKVEVNPAFVRPNEVHRLCGSPAKLDTLLMKHKAAVANPPLEETLQRMLALAAAQPN